MVSPSKMGLCRNASFVQRMNPKCVDGCPNNAIVFEERTEVEYVIVGNSRLQLRYVEGIRETDKEGVITVISDEVHHTYSRLPDILSASKENRHRE